LTAAHLTDLTLGTIDMTLAWYTAWIAVVSHVAPVHTASQSQDTHLTSRDTLSLNNGLVTVVDMIMKALKVREQAGHS